MKLNLCSPSSWVVFSGSKLIKVLNCTKHMDSKGALSKSSVWPITKGKLSTANAISPKSKCINLQENNKIILLEETLKPSQCFLCIFTLKEIKELLKCFSMDSLRTWSELVRTIWLRYETKKKLVLNCLTWPLYLKSACALDTLWIAVSYNRCLFINYFLSRYKRMHLHSQRTLKCMKTAKHCVKIYFNKYCSGVP